MRLLAVLVALIAGCYLGCYSDEPGVRLVVRDPGLDVVRVELFLGTEAAPTKNIAPDKARDGETRGKLRAKEAFTLDGPKDGITPVTERPLVDGRAVWDLRARDDEPTTTIARVLAVGFAASGEIVGIARYEYLNVPSSETVAYVLTLEPATELAPSETLEPHGKRVWRWKTDEDSAACIGVEDSDGATLTREWLVPKNDPDCDSMPIECDEFYFAANERLASDSPGAANCFAADEDAMGIRTRCELGNRPCIDGVAPGTCIAFDDPKYCAANAFCNADVCTAGPTACGAAIPTTIYECEHLLSVTGMQCTEGTQGPLVVDLSGLFPNGCSHVAFTPFDLDNGVAPTAVMPAGSGATYAIEQPTTPNVCKFAVKLTGTVGASSSTQLYALDVTLARDHVIVPLTIKANPGGCLLGRDSFCTSRRGQNESIDDCD